MTATTAVPARKAGTVFALALALLLAGPLADHSAHAATSEQKAMRRLINKERSSRGKPKVRLKDNLNRIATRHSRRMASSNELYHNSRLSYECRNMSWRILGENVGVGSSVWSLHRAFMASTPHRKNILRSSFRKIGVGIARGGGRTWVTVVFLG